MAKLHDVSGRLEAGVTTTVVTAILGFRGSISESASLPLDLGRSPFVVSDFVVMFMFERLSLVAFTFLSKSARAVVGSRSLNLASSLESSEAEADSGDFGT